MLSRVFASSALLLPLLLSAEPASAQRISADIRIGGGPIAGHIRIGPDRFGYRDYRPRFVRVEVLRARDYYRRSGWLRSFRRDARIRAVYYDRGRDFYYDRFRPGLIQINVFEREGRFYRWDDDRFDRWVCDRWNDDRWDDRYDGLDRYDRNGSGNDRYDRQDDRYDRRDDRYDRRDDRRDRRDDRGDRRDDRRDRGGRPGQ
jgi:hypothetical protein